MLKWCNLQEQCCLLGMCCEQKRKALIHQVPLKLLANLSRTEKSRLDIEQICWENSQELVCELGRQIETAFNSVRVSYTDARDKYFTDLTIAVLDFIVPTSSLNPSIL